MAFSPLSPLLGGITVYFFSSLGGVALVKFLNYDIYFTSWLWIALVSRSNWLLAAPLHWCLLRKEEGVVLAPVSRRQLGLYFVIAVGLSMVEAINSLTLSSLPGSLYALLKGSDVGFSMLLSGLFLRKTYCCRQVVAAVSIMTGVALVFWLGPPSAPRRGRDDEDDAGGDPSEASSSSGLIDNIVLASFLCVVGALINAACSVWTEGFLKILLTEEQERLLGGMGHHHEHPSRLPSKLLLSNAYSMWTSFFAFCILIVAAALGGQLFTLRESLTPFDGDSSGSMENARVRNFPPLAVVLILLFFIGLSRFLERLSKYWICVCDSAMTFSVVQAARRLFGVYLLAVIFGESLNQTMWIGSLCCGLGFVLHAWKPDRRDLELSAECGRNSSRREISRKDGSGHSYELVSTTHPPHNKT